MKIAIDGTSGVGKSTYAKMLASQYGLVYVDTGALYRSIGLFVCEKGIAKDDKSSIIASLPEIALSLCYSDEGQRVILNGRDVSGLIRTPEISMYASAVSSIPEVRQFLLKIQRDMVDAGNVIMDGRDIGTVIMPDADVKFFLVASNEVRARRRYDELTAKGTECNYDEILADMNKRDEDDRNRDIAPAVPADDAVILDNSNLTIEGTLDAMKKIILEKTGK